MLFGGARSALPVTGFRSIEVRVGRTVAYSLGGEETCACWRALRGSLAALFRAQAAGPLRAAVTNVAVRNHR